MVASRVGGSDLMLPNRRSPPPPHGIYQAMRGASFLVAVTFAAEIGDVRRFDTPRQLMSFLGLVPAESSTGDTIRRKGLTLAGNRRARRALVEAAWTYRYPARVRVGLGHGFPNATHR